MHRNSMICMVVLFVLQAGVCPAQGMRGGGTPLPANAPTSAIVISSKELVTQLTPRWTGERSEDGRPVLPEALIKRVKNVSIVQAWTEVTNAGYRNNYTTGEGWMVMRPDEAIVGRVLTAQYMPTNPDLNSLIAAKGRGEGRVGNSNSWPIDMLKKGDVYVADGYGKINEGTLIGDNLGNAIFANSGNGVIFNASVRDWEGLQEIKGFNAWVKGAHPSAIANMMLTGINVPIRIGDAVATPGDIVLAKPEGIVFIPPHLVERMVVSAEQTMLRDMFGHQRLQEKKYTPGQIDSGWTPEINADYSGWLKENIDKLPVPRDVIEGMLNAPAGGRGGRGGRGG
jgi:4-hydroxy-4-methyl-2-oxoglutarate aldolase